jgi:hypothetical protein
MKKTNIVYFLLCIKNYIDQIFSKKVDVEDAKKTFRKIKITIGADDKLEVVFKGTNNLDDCKSIAEALIKLDSLLPNNK